MSISGGLFEQDRFQDVIGAGFICIIFCFVFVLCVPVEAPYDIWVVRGGFSVMVFIVGLFALNFRSRQTFHQIESARTQYHDQISDKVFSDHLERVRASFDIVNDLSIKSMKPIEKSLGFELDNILFSDIDGDVKSSLYLSDSACLQYLKDVIEAGRLIQAAYIVYLKYRSLIDSAVQDLSDNNPLDEHQWSAKLTWRQFEKRALVLEVFMLRINRLIEGQPEDSTFFEGDVKEVAHYLQACAEWKKGWINTGMGF